MTLYKSVFENKWQRQRGKWNCGGNGCDSGTNTESATENDFGSGGSESG